MTLKIKSKLLYLAITVLCLIPALVITAVALVLYQIPPKSYFRDRLAYGCVMMLVNMSAWRRETVYWYTVNKKQGFELNVD